MRRAPFRKPGKASRFTASVFAFSRSSATASPRCTSRRCTARRLPRWPRALSFLVESELGSSFLFEHDLFRKPVPTFRDHALGIRADLELAEGRRGLGPWVPQWWGGPVVPPASVRHWALAGGQAEALPPVAA